MNDVCRHCGAECKSDDRAPWHCPNCGQTDWLNYWALETREHIVARLKLQVRDILKGNPFAGIGHDPDGHYLAMIPCLCDRWLTMPQRYGEFIGIVNDIEQIEEMVFGASGARAIKTHAVGSRYVSLKTQRG